MIEAAIAIGAIAIVLTSLSAFLLWRGWTCTVSFTAKTKEGLVSLGGGVELAGFSLSAAAILGGPGVVVLHFRSRELLRMPLPPPPSEQGFFGRLVTRIRDWLLPRTDLDALPEAGMRMVLGLREPSMTGTVTCGFADPALTGKMAAVLYPIAGMLAPLGTLEMRFDWSGRTVIDADLEGSFRIVPARIARETVVFAWRHVHARPKLQQKADVSHTLAT